MHASETPADGAKRLVTSQYTEGRKIIWGNAGKYLSSLRFFEPTWHICISELEVERLGSWMRRRPVQ